MSLFNNAQAIEFLQRAIDNPMNETMLNLSSAAMSDRKRAIVSELGVSPEAEECMLSQLDGYRLVEDLYDLREGRYTRWVSLSSGHPSLTNGGVLVRCRLGDGVTLVFKNRGRFFQCDMNTSLIFQKLTPQEIVVQAASGMI